jgi:hypothetical protein
VQLTALKDIRTPLIRKIKIKDYNRRWSKSMKRWLRFQEPPRPFWNKFCDIKPEFTILKLLQRIGKELMILYGKKRNKARSFADSRFTLLPQMLKRGMVSCGALALIFCTVLRKFGIPTKLVHGRIRGQSGQNRHAWLKIYHPSKRIRLAIDPGQWHRNFQLKPSARQLKIYASWEELKRDYNKGIF